MLRISIVLAFVALFSPFPARAVSPVVVELAFPRLQFEKITDIQHAADGSERLYVLEQKGVIKAFRNDRLVQGAEVFLDIKKRVNSLGGEEGLLGLAFHPQFAKNGFFYVNYTAERPKRTVIARYRRDPKNPRLGLFNSELVILEIPDPYSNHNGGQLAFGPDGFLYIATGDGGSGGDPHRNGQYRKTLLGKILRIDVDRTEKDRAYAIPKDNPYYDNTSGYREEIYAYGLRNPWRMSFDSLNGKLYAADVGQNRREEVDRIEKGKNYGWNILEGSLCFSPATGCDQSGLTPPIAEYDHALGASITGGYVYRGARLPFLNGAYLYGDFVSGRIWALWSVGNRYEAQELLRTSLNISTFGIDENGEVYIASYAEGKIYRFAPAY